MNSRQSWNITTLFLVVIFGFTAATMLRPVKDFSEKENRKLQGRPQVTLKGIADGSFEKEYEDYLTDQFIFRDDFKKLNTNMQRAMLRQDVNDVYFAKDDYLIEAYDGVFDTELAEGNVTRLAAFADEAVSRYGEGHVSVMVVPTAVSILKDKLPPFASPYDQNIYLDKLSAALPDNTFFDCRDILSAHSDEEIYYRTDHHWTTYGADLVYEQWRLSRGFEPMTGDDLYTQVVSENFEGTIAAKVGQDGRADTIEAYEPADQGELRLVYNQSDDVRDMPYYFEALSGRDQYAFFLGGNYGLIQMETKAGTGRRLLVLKDSYAHCLVPLMAKDFDQVDLVDVRYFTQSLKEFMDENDYTDVLVLYNAAGFAEDQTIGRLLA